MTRPDPTARKRYHPCAKSNALEVTLEEKSASGNSFVLLLLLLLLLQSCLVFVFVLFCSEPMGGAGRPGDEAAGGSISERGGDVERLSPLIAVIGCRRRSGVGRGV